MILTGDEIRTLCVYKRMIAPFAERTVYKTGLTYGCGVASYDVRFRDNVVIYPGQTTLAVTLEEFNMPNDICGFVHDKSSWAREGLSHFNTFIDPGWCGFLTLELTLFPKHGRVSGPMSIAANTPACQIVFMQMTRMTTGYQGRYQNQPPEPVAAKLIGCE